MRSLQTVMPTAEQLPLIQNSRAGVKLIRGAAGSGKTTTAILRLKQLAAAWLQRRERIRSEAAVRALVVTFNRTLRGYVADLAEKQIAARTHLDLTVSTFGKWATDQLPHHRILERRQGVAKIEEFGQRLHVGARFLSDETDYVLGRFLPSNWNEYLTATREGRGNSPRMDQALRQRLLDEVIRPYDDWKHSIHRHDFNDLAVELAERADPIPYDIIIADEAQDLSANEVRALIQHAARVSSVTFVLDAAQRIYPRGFPWREAGVIIQPADSHRLKKNYRNTREIAAFALPLLEGLEIGDDGTLPDLKSCARHGELPIVLRGRYSAQLTYAAKYLADNVNIAEESVAFLKPSGGQWFANVKQMLAQHSYEYVEITRQSEWPEGNANIALSTMNSAKGLEFDHVVILGLNEQVTPHGAGADDSAFQTLRRLLAMAITRAKKSVVLGYKPEDMSSLVKFFQPGTFREVTP